MVICTFQGQTNSLIHPTHFFWQSSSSGFQTVVRNVQLLYNNGCRLLQEREGDLRIPTRVYVSAASTFGCPWALGDSRIEYFRRSYQCPRPILKIGSTGWTYRRLVERREPICKSDNMCTLVNVKTTPTCAVSIFEDTDPRNRTQTSKPTYNTKFLVSPNQIVKPPFFLSSSISRNIRRTFLRLFFIGSMERRVAIVLHIATN